jgi:hypothetical protein
MIWNVYRRRRLWSNLEEYLGICPEELNKSQNSLQDICSLGCDPKPPERKAGVLMTR